MLYQDKGKSMDVCTADLFSAESDENISSTMNRRQDLRNLRILIFNDIFEQKWVIKIVSYIC